MTRKTINPWSWQEKFGYVQANEVSHPQRMLFCAGVVPVDRNGEILFSDNMDKQIHQIFNNLEIILQEADMKLSDVVRLTYYTTDIEQFKRSFHVVLDRLDAGDCNPSTSLIGVASLYHPECSVEFEATAVI